MHHCLNAVADREGQGSAVLFRAIEPLWDVHAMRTGAPTNLPDHLVASGPGRLCRALRIDKRLNDTDLVSGDIRVLPCTDDVGDIRVGVRVGLASDDERHWRFWVDSPSVSRFSRHPGRKR
jgi:DNA-3-methyladenine glycosylase